MTLGSYILLRGSSAFQVTMASGPTMTEPICLVEDHGEQLNVNQKALQILDKISQPVMVVGIVGQYRTGKSYLLNRLVGQNHGECCSGTGAICLEPAILQIGHAPLMSSKRRG